MVRCPFCGSHNVIALPLGDYLCLDCDEQFYEGEQPTPVQRISGRALSLVIKHGPRLLTAAASAAKDGLPAILKAAKVFF